jgi:hypothetical protein
MKENSPPRSGDGRLEQRQLAEGGADWFLEQVRAAAEI